MVQGWANWTSGEAKSALAQARRLPQRPWQRKGRILPRGVVAQVSSRTVHVAFDTMFGSTGVALRWRYMRRRLRCELARAGQG